MSIEGLVFLVVKFCFVEFFLYLICRLEFDSCFMVESLLYIIFGEFVFLGKMFIGCVIFIFLFIIGLGGVL